PCRRSGIKDLEHGRGVNLWIESACWKTLSDKQLVFSKNRYTSNVAICVDIVQGKTSLNSLRLSFIFGGESQIGKALDNLHGFQADSDHLADQADDIFGIINSVRVIHNAATLVGADLILINDPFQSGAVSEAVLERFRRNTPQSQEPVVEDRCFVAT